MKNRLKKKAKKRRMHAALEVCRQAIEINGLQQSRKEFTGSHPTVFLYFDGHIGCITVDIHSQGWVVGQSCDRQYKTLICRRKLHSDEMTPDKTAQELRRLKKEFANKQGGGHRATEPAYEAGDNLPYI